MNAMKATIQLSFAKWLSLFLFLNVYIKSTLSAISCYQCSSKNGTDPNCEDPMAPAYLPISKHCMVPKENHVGNFPANFCVKMIGTSIRTGNHLVIRTCVLEDMNNQCGTFRFEDDTLRGCILTCTFDGCNRGVSTFPEKSLLISTIFSILVSTLKLF